MKRLAFTVVFLASSCTVETEPLRTSELPATVEIQGGGDLLPGLDIDQGGCDEEGRAVLAGAPNLDPARPGDIFVDEAGNRFVIVAIEDNVVVFDGLCVEDGSQPADASIHRNSLVVADGNVGIGTSLPMTRLHVNAGDLAVGGNITLAADLSPDTLRFGNFNDPVVPFGAGQELYIRGDDARVVLAQGIPDGASFALAARGPGGDGRLAVIGQQGGAGPGVEIAAFWPNQRVGVGVSSEPHAQLVLRGVGDIVGQYAEFDQAARWIADLHSSPGAGDEREAQLGVFGTNVPSPNSIALTSGASGDSGLAFVTRHEVPGMYDDLKTRMVITGRGNVGMGTTSPAARLHVKEELPDTAPTLIEGNSHGTIGLRHGYLGDTFTWWLFSNGGNFGVRGVGDAALGSAPDRLTIDQAGNVGIGTTNPTDLLHLETPIGVPNRAVVKLTESYRGGGVLGAASGAGNGGSLAFHTHDAVGSFPVRGVIDHLGNFGLGTSTPDVRLDVDGDIEYTGTINDVSDARMKEAVTELPGMLTRLQWLRPVSFRMRDDEKRPPEMGFIAQDVERVYPELVRTANDQMGTKSLNYIGLIAPLVKATQELAIKDDELDAANRALQRKVAAQGIELEAFRTKMMAQQEINRRLEARLGALESRVDADRPRARRPGLGAEGWFVAAGAVAVVAAVGLGRRRRSDSGDASRS